MKKNQSGCMEKIREKRELLEYVEATLEALEYRKPTEPTSVERWEKYTTEDGEERWHSVEVLPEDITDKEMEQFEMDCKKYKMRMRAWQAVVDHIEKLL